jgi:hypothetical protein
MKRNIRKKRKKHTRVCIVDTVYALLLYLLISSEDEICDTYFFFSTGIPRFIRKKFPGHYFFYKKKKFILKLIHRIYMIMFVRFGKTVRWPFLRNVKIFGQDHLLYFPYLTGNKKYTLIEDAPNMMYLNTKIIRSLDDFWKSDRFFTKRLLSKILGGVYKHYYANNSICEEVILTENESAPHLKGKKLTIVSTHSLWKHATETKKKLILSTYNIGKEDIDILNSKQNILFSQQFSDDGFITKEEQYRIYRKIIDNYDRNSILIKIHPRDTFDYKKAFPDIAVFNKIVPAQLFDLLDVKFKKAITVSSSAVTSFPYDIEIDWYGTEVNDSLFKIFGHIDVNEIKKI